jgi:protein-tyrosine phosphatase
MHIGAVLSVTSEEKNLTLPPNIRRLSIDLEDIQSSQIYNFFNTTYHFIDDNMRSTNVLVHCMAGVSRSATLVIAYLMKKNKIPL